MRKLLLPIVFALSSTSLHAAVVVHNTDVVTAPTNSVGFEGLPHTFDGSGGIVEDGVNIKYVTTIGNAGIWTTYFNPVGLSGWYKDGGGFGFTEISLVGLGTISAMDFLVGNGFSSTNNLLYEVLFQGSVVGSGNAGSYNHSSSGSSFGFSGQFDTVRLKSSFATTFDPTAVEALAIDRIRVASVAAAVPEPATWAMMLLGFGAIGFGMRRRNKQTIRTNVSFA